jgi:hypothetical protein
VKAGLIVVEGEKDERMPIVQPGMLEFEFAVVISILYCALLRKVESKTLQCKFFT